MKILMKVTNERGGALFLKKKKKSILYIYFVRILYILICLKNILLEFRNIYRSKKKARGAKKMVANA